MNAMTDTPPAPAKPTSSDIPLEDIDALLAAEDPEFTKSLDEVRAVDSDPTVVIEASAVDEGLGGEEKVTLPPEGELEKTRFENIKIRLRTRWREGRVAFKQRLKAMAMQGLANFIIFLKTRPKEFVLFSIATLKVLAKNATFPIVAFGKAKAPARLAVLTLLMVAVGSLWVLLANFKGIWLPHIHEPTLADFSKVADSVDTFNPKDESESFYSAFPQERYEFLFPKMKVNLRRTRSNPLPMGAFEFVVQVDSRDTAIELRDREVELTDLLQRICEEESFVDLESELGKSRFKSRIKHDLDQKLTQGWVKEVNFKTFILKP